MGQRRPPRRAGHTPAPGRPGRPQSSGQNQNQNQKPKPRPHRKPGHGPIQGQGREQVHESNRHTAPPRQRPHQRPVQGSSRPGSRTNGPRPGPGFSADPESGSGPQRLQKVLAQAGIGSRRGCEELILQGRVTVDGRLVRELGTRVDPSVQKVAVDGQKIHAERLVYFAVHKPKGYVSTNHDPAGRPRVIDLLPEVPERTYTVGRLDEQSTGLMILTNDGALANRLAHPRFGIEKLYRVVVAGSPSREVLNQVVEGVWLAEGKVRARRVRVVGTRGESTILELTLAEGKNREVRRMFAAQGHKVMSLTRIAVGPIVLKGLAVGAYRPLSAAEVGLLRKVAQGIAVPTPWARGGDRDRNRDRNQGRDQSRVPRRDRGESIAQGEGSTSGPPPRRPGRPPSTTNRPPLAASEGPAPRGPRRAPTAGRPVLGPGPGTGPRSIPGSGQRQGQGQGTGPGRPPRPRPSGPPRSSSSSPPPVSEPHVPTRSRRIIGLQPPPADVSESGSAGPRPRPRGRRPLPPRRHLSPPRAGQGPRRTRPAGGPERGPENEG